MAMQSPRSGGVEQTHLIVQCPLCQTKFAVEASAISAIESPRFHCSRCDNIFAFDTNSPPSRYPLREGVRSSALPTSAEDPTPPSRAPLPDKPWAHSISDQTEKGIRSTGEAQLDLFQGSAVRSPSTVVPDTRPAPQPELPESSIPTVPSSAFSATLGSPLPPTPKTISRWSSFLMMGGPVVFFLSAILGVSYYLRQNATRADDLLVSLSSELPQVAPLSLTIEEPRFREVVLDSGETLRLVSGTLMNASEFTFRSIELEVLGFNGNGDVVSRIRIDSGSTLAKTRVRSLSPAMIRELQSGKIRNRQDLRPGESQDFTIALLDGEPATIRHFSARVHSVVVKRE